jgi:hypothetical protein
MTSFNGIPRNGCSACGQDFSSVAMFDLHRVGVHSYDWSPERPDGRRCLDEEEMEAKGWELNADGRWHDPEHTRRVREAFSELDPRPQTRRAA